MQIQNTTPNFTGRVICIHAKDNKNVKFLYNKVADIVSHPNNRVPTTFNPEFISIEGPSDYPKNINIVVEKLKLAGIKFLDSINK